MTEYDPESDGGRHPPLEVFAENPGGFSVYKANPGCQCRL